MAFQILRSPGFKIAGIGILTLLMLVPLAQVAELINERAGRQREAEQQTARQWGAAQWLLPAYVQATVPAPTTVDSNFNVPATMQRPATTTQVFAPDTAQVDAELLPELRHRGMFDVVVYTARVQVRARYDAATWQTAMAARSPDTALALRLALSDAHGIRKLDNVTVNGVPAAANAVGPGLGALPAVDVALPADLPADRDVELAYTLELAGTREFRVVPFARASTATMAGAWADPSYLGAHLPTQHTLEDGRFDARWSISPFNGTLAPRSNVDDLSWPVLEGAGLGVELYQPADLYQQNERSGKYGLLVIALVFVAMFLFEIVAGLMVHPIQYLLVGFALALFYLLLLALSEHVGFGPAYFLAGTAATVLVGAYAIAALQSWRRGVLLAAMQAAAYGVFYVLVRSEDHALLLGASALFIALAAVMFLTRRTNWYALGAARARDPAVPPSSAA